MTTRRKKATAALIVSLGFAAIVALASGCELLVKLDVALAETDGGAPPCTLCLDGTVEPDGNIEFGPADAGTDARDSSEAESFDSGSDQDQ